MRSKAHQFGKRTICILVIDPNLTLIDPNLTLIGALHGPAIRIVSMYCEKLTIEVLISIREIERRQNQLEPDTERSISSIKAMEKLDTRK